MAAEATVSGDDSGPVLKPRWRPADDELDFTPMIDMTFLLMVFFLLTYIPSPQRAVDLPQAAFGTTVDPQTSVVITIAQSEDQEVPQVYLADGKFGEPLQEDPKTQEETIRQAIEAGYAEGKSTVILKAEGFVKSKHINRIARVVATVDGVQLHLAVSDLRQ